MGCDPCRRAKALGEVRADVKYMQMDDQGIEKLKQQGFATMPVVYMQTSPTEFKYIGGGGYRDEKVYMNLDGLKQASPLKDEWRRR